MTVRLIIIDPENDFCNSGGNPKEKKGSLYVEGADVDMTRLAFFIDKEGHQIDEIDVSIDAHYKYDIGHPCSWINEAGENPLPFTVFNKGDVRNGVWKFYDPSMTEFMKYYEEVLEQKDRYKIMIWPEHCRVNEWGSQIHPILRKSLAKWEEDKKKNVKIHFKGMCPYVENYSIFQADCPFPGDPSTFPRWDIIAPTLKDEMILWAGEALNVCVANSILDYADFVGGLEKCYFLRDTTSNVPGYESLGDAFLQEAKAKGMKVVTTKIFD